MWMSELLLLTPCQCSPSHRDDRTWETKLGIFGGDGNSPREDCHLVGHVPSWASRTPLRKTRIHSRPLSDAAEHAGVGRVVYRSPILVETLFAPPTARRTPQGVEHSDQILGTRLTRGLPTHRWARVWVRKTQRPSSHVICGKATSRHETRVQTHECCAALAGRVRHIARPKARLEVEHSASLQVPVSSLRVSDDPRAWRQSNAVCAPMHSPTIMAGCAALRTRRITSVVTARSPSAPPS